MQYLGANFLTKRAAFLRPQRLEKITDNEEKELEDHANVLIDRDRSVFRL
jgi:hypothetical protein